MNYVYLQAQGAFTDKLFSFMSTQREKTFDKLTVEYEGEKRIP